MEQDEELLFGEIAVKMRLMTHEQLVDCLMAQQGDAPPGRQLGAIAVDKGFLQQEDLQQILDRQAAARARRGERDRWPALDSALASPARDRPASPSMEVLLADYVVNEQPGTPWPPPRSVGRESATVRQRSATAGRAAGIEDLLAAYVGGTTPAPTDAPAQTPARSSSPAPGPARPSSPAPGPAQSRPRAQVEARAPAQDAGSAAAAEHDLSVLQRDADAAQPVRPELVPQPQSLTGDHSLVRPPATAASQQLIEMLLREAFERGASDLHLHAGAPPLLRCDGLLQPIDGQEPLSEALAEQVIAHITDDQQWARFRRAGEVDFAYSVPLLGRVRVNAYRQQRGPDVVFRLIPLTPPTLQSLGLPPDLARLLHYRTGMVLCTGPAGCGKSTTLAALLNEVASQRADHIITVEDPIEVAFPVTRSLINQRQLGDHTASCARALRAALREDPDVIAIAELRDPETIALSMTAAETGHLVLGTLHTGSAAQTINRIIYAFPADQQGQIRAMLAESLRAVISQRLAARRDGCGRVAALELLVVNPAVANMIRENKTYQIPSAMQVGRAHGMRQLDDSLQQLVAEGKITALEARRHALNPGRFS